jgi:hypothetical protein
MEGAAAVPRPSLPRMPASRPRAWGRARATPRSGSLRVVAAPPLRALLPSAVKTRDYYDLRNSDLKHGILWSLDWTGWAAAGPGLDMGVGSGPN